MDPNTIVATSNPFASLDNRICCVTAGPNQIFIGTVGGDIKVTSRATGELQADKSWRQTNTPIEGMMYDYEGKFVYATEYNLVILDKDFSQKLKEVRSTEPLRKIFYHFSENSPSSCKSK